MYSCVRYVLNNSVKQCFNNAASAQKGKMLHSGDAVHIILTFVLEPCSVSTIGAVCKQLLNQIYDPNSWEVSIVDTSCIKPKGIKAHSHYLFWTHAKYIINGKYSSWDCSLLMSKLYWVWHWQYYGNVHFKSIMGKTMAISQRPVTLSVSLRAQCTDELTI